MITRHKKIIGLMSGSSLDGLDIACTRFDYTLPDQHDRVNDDLPDVEPIRFDGFQIEMARTVPYPDEWRNSLLKASSMSARELCVLDKELGTFFGRQVKLFIREHDLDSSLVSSHGHTVYHDPLNGYSLQIGSGISMAVACGLPVVYDFRNADIALGGQGAPMAPLADHYLFSDFDLCINIGGIANIGIARNLPARGYDICPANQLLNHLARMAGRPFDQDGRIGSSGKLSDNLLVGLMQHPFHLEKPPKSLSNQTIFKSWLPLILGRKSALPVEDLLHTATVYVAKSISLAIRTEIQNGSGSRVLLTGGGAFNTFLVDRIKAELGDTDAKVYLPDEEVISYKEAVLIALAGLLRIESMPNFFHSVTGARSDACGGVVAIP